MGWGRTEGREGGREGGRAATCLTTVCVYMNLPFLRFHVIDHNGNSSFKMYLFERNNSTRRNVSTYSFTSSSSLPPSLPPSFHVAAPPKSSGASSSRARNMYFTTPSWQPLLGMGPCWRRRKAKG